MAGCDFLPSLQNIGIKKAHALIKKHRDFVKVWITSIRLQNSLIPPHPHPNSTSSPQACKNLRFSGVAIPREYEERLQRTLWVFRHQRVFCPRAGTVVHLRPLPPGGLGARDVDVMSAVPHGEDPLDFLGPMMEDGVARGIAAGASQDPSIEPINTAADD